MQAGDFLMAEKNSNQSNFIRRQKDAQIPSSIAPMKRKAKPEDPAQKPLLNSVTLQEDLTEEQLQPLSKREKPAPSEEVFPAPLPSRKISAGSHAQFRSSAVAPSAKPMTRHTVQTGYKAEWKYTNAEDVVNAKDPNEENETGHKVKRNGSVTAEVVKMPINKQPLILSAVAFFLALIIILGCIFGITSAGSSTKPSISYSDKPILRDTEILSPVDPSNRDLKDAYHYEYTGNSIVGTSFEYKGTIDKENIVKPVAETKNEGLTENGLSKYPTFGSTPSGVLGSGEEQVAMRNKLIAESVYVASSNTSHNSGRSPHPYNKIDAEGKLWYVNGGNTDPSVDDEGNQRYLYAHTSSVGMYFGNVSPDEPRIIKEVTMRPRGYNGYGVTGLYAPAGEVIKIEIDDKDMTATGGLTIHIGQALYNGQANNIWTAKNKMNRFPVILNTMLVNKSTATKNENTGKWEAYIGSFIGGPLYIRNTNAKFTATISGCVAYSHFILGYTTKAEFEENKKSTAPYFDLEVWDRGVLHSGPVYYAKNFSYEDLYKVAVLWDKVASVTTYGSNQGIVFLYEPFVAAGAAVAFPGRRSVNCPTDWMANSLNYNTIVTSGGWGNFHEYHHNFQGYGVGNGGEVTNNGLTLVSYALFTKISSKRGIGSFGAQGLGGWNNYTSATFAMEETLKIARPNESPSNGNQGLALYANLLHNFGANAYMNAKVAGGGQSYAAYMNAWQKVTHNNMYYYFNEILKGSGISNNADSSYPMFVPLSCVYQTGRSYMYDGKKKYFQTMQPYVIPAGVPFNIDLSRYTAPSGQYASGSIVMPEGFEYKIKSVTKPSNGKIEIADDYNLKYTPDSNNKSLRSGPMLVTLEIKKTDGAFKVDDVDLILEFEQSYETNKMTLERTTYTYTAENMPTDVVDAYNSNFHGATKVESDHSNPTQNANTDVWLVPDNDAGHQKFPNAKDQEIAKPNQIIEVKGKLYFDEAGKYRIYLRGRVNCAMYYSTDGGKTYQLGATVKNGSGSGFYLNNPDTYVDLDVEAKSWIYYKSAFITLTEKQTTIGYMGLGLGQWRQTMFTIAERYYNAAGTEVESADDEEYSYTETTYNDMNGHPVAVTKQVKGSTETEYYKIVNNNRVESTMEEVAKLTESKLLPPTSASYVNAYRSNYQFPDNSSFESDYFYVRNYNYNYTDNLLQNSNQTIIESNYTSHSWSVSTFPLSNLTDGNRNTFIHTNNWGNSVDRPLEFVIDMGEAKPVNRMTIYTQYRPNGDYHTAKTFTLEGSLDGETFFPVGTFENVPRNNLATTVNFEEITFRYYRLIITGSTGSHVIISEIEMWRMLEINGNGANLVAPNNDALIFVGNWKSESMQSSFGYAYVGERGSKLKFEMIGTRLAILTSTLHESNFEVYIDGKKCDSVSVKQVDGDFGITYLSRQFEYGKHKVEIRCKGKTYIDSLAIYNESQS